MYVHSKAALCGNTVLPSAICHRILYHCVPVFIQRKMFFPLFLSEQYITYFNQCYKFIKFIREVKSSLFHFYKSYNAECTCTCNSLTVEHRVQ